MNKKMFKDKIKKNKDIILIGSFLLFLLILTVSVSAFNFPSNSNKVTTTIYSSNITNFTELLDTPNSYSGNSGKCVAVNGGGTGLTFVECSAGGSYVPYSGASGTVNLNGQALTNVGALIVAGLTTTQDLIPTTNNLYSIGNTTNRYQNIYGINIYGTTINSTNITSSNINSNSLNSTNVSSQLIDSNNVNVSTNLTIGGFKVNKVGTDLVITLT
jgi:hypothetical protein